MEELLEVGLQCGRRLIGITTLLEHVETKRTSNENDAVRALPHVIKTFVRVCRKLKPPRRRGLGGEHLRPNRLYIGRERRQQQRQIGVQRQDNLPRTYTPLGRLQVDAFSAVGDRKYGMMRQQPRTRLLNDVIDEIGRAHVSTPV